MNFTHYCNISGSICNKNYRLMDHSPCCIKCSLSCSNCIVRENPETFRCEYMITKEDLIKLLIYDLNNQKEELLRELEQINISISTLKGK